MEHVNSPSPFARRPLPVGVRCHVALIFCRVRTIPLFMRLAEHLPLLTTNNLQCMKIIFHSLLLLSQSHWLITGGAIIQNCVLLNLSTKTPQVMKSNHCNFLSELQYC